MTAADYTWPEPQHVRDLRISRDNLRDQIAAAITWAETRDGLIPVTRLRALLAQEDR